jgi:hypothetical protein
MTTDDGGSAFPLAAERFPDGDLISVAQYGMTLRDYFAAQALSGLVCPPGNTSGCYSPPHAADVAYQYADAMIAARMGVADMWCGNTPKCPDK